MILEVFSKTTRERVGIIKMFKFCQYTREFCGSGSFSIKVSIEDTIIRSLNPEHMILFDQGVMGIIKNVKMSTEESIVTVQGYLLNKLLYYRSFLVTKVFKGMAGSIARDMVDFFFIRNSDSRRNIPGMTLSTDDKYNPILPKTSIQATGKTVGYVMESLLGSFDSGYDIVPIIAAYDESSDKPTNISSYEFRVLAPANRSIENTDGNTPVIFSKTMNNLSSATYEEDATEYCSVAIVAGEGEGTERITLEVGDTVASGIDRIELYVDARDLQSSLEDGTTMTEDEYRQVLKNRGESHLEDARSFLSFDGTIIDGASSYVYGKDFFLGDYVSVIEKTLGIIATVQISSVTKSLTESGEKIDIVFGKEKVLIQKIIRKRGVV